MTDKRAPDLSGLIAQDRPAGPAADALRAALSPPAEALAGYLAGTLGEAECARVVAWLAADPAHRDLLEDIGAGQAFSPVADAALQARLAALEPAPRVVAPRLARARRPVFGFRWAGAFASIALLVLAGILVVPSLMERTGVSPDEAPSTRSKVRDQRSGGEPAPRRAEEAERRPAEPKPAPPPEDARRPAPPGAPPAAGAAAPPSVRLASSPEVLAAIRAAATAQSTVQREADRNRRAAADPLAPFNAACPADWPRCCAEIRFDPALLDRLRRGEAPAAFEMILRGRKPNPGLCELRAAR